MVTVKEATEIVLKETSKSEYYILGCEDCVTAFVFHLMPKGVSYEPGKTYYCMNLKAVVYKKNGKLAWMELLEYIAALPSTRKRTETGMTVKTYDISAYLPNEYKEAAKQWYAVTRKGVV